MMKSKDLTLLVLLVLGITFLLLLTFSHCEDPGRTTALTGTVEWVATDAKNDISLVAIATQSGEFLVGDDATGKEFLQLVNKRVSVKGKVTEDQHGRKTIRVSEYKIVPQ